MRKLLLTTLFLLPFSSHAALVGRLSATEGGTDYQAYYDTEADLTWLADANAAAGSIYETVPAVPGAINLSDSNAFVSNINISGITGWRLPSTMQPDVSCVSNNGLGSYGTNCIGSELGNLFYNVLGGIETNSISTNHNSNYDLFSNIQTTNFYWSSTVYDADTDQAWFFDMDYGSQYHTVQTANQFVWAVHDGDIGAVPIPAAVWLFGSGLIGLVGFARRKRNA